MCGHLILLVCFVSYACSTLAAMHYGYCPEDKDYGEVKWTSCTSDQVCKTHERCCQVGDTVKCVTAVNYLASLWEVKKGRCPSLTSMRKAKGTECKADQDCKEKELCCASVCTVPLPIQPTANSGYCPPHDPVLVHNTTCMHDSDCGSYKKCCQVGNGTECRNGLFEKTRHVGWCPKVKDDSELATAKLCNGDSDCFGTLKCCPTSSAMRCQNGQQHQPPPKPGYCKEPKEKRYLQMQPGCTSDYDCVGSKKCCYKEGTDDCVDVN
uniref:WAP domain-containing protein n=2 Tax=Trichuris muris TaxID=70415 RepID=A0A5S6QHN5_TRIMR